MSPLPRLMVAPTGARKTKADHPALPITLDEIIDTARSCQAAGADGLHLHLRDTNGRHILDAGLYKEALTALSTSVPGMEVQITTEAVGIYSAAQQRAVVEAVVPQSVSISLAEMLAEREFDAAEAFYKACAQANTDVQHIIYGASDLDLLATMLEEDRLPGGPVQLLFVLGRYSLNQESAPNDLDLFTRWLSTSKVAADWAVCAFGQQETACLAAAAAAGGKLRVGFENSIWNADGRIARDNAERVAEIKTMMAAQKSR
ncbi:MAG: 3-keto-5-aminohexanoate cleavage protein [Desulfomicrobium sp.]|uniref:3-keto-5-aminohexanoate cleavage protein n=1 Tax=Hoeflea sp. TaxID=1940281 RepID=UPI0025BE5AD2|nr:3-keto-5-aminohexanoate cleavage protein [Hoeflea sp.]MBU4528009.1 3-keto-5-aminohexanoate cleavage protein [Alphaproteobacteria bacterium]MBU4542283.1 3-keto-5-aminohexanoate cleavage protein [Alphaproteobacteria bacterium]MBU4549013.1 3-keto-5-aminohexanoate cleavage protein [Alphaproteobacteria bacterium]MBV1712608.1 3-keto-5-aminohexanoate cleavage protein [Desulfomicrobium sp.]